MHGSMNVKFRDVIFILVCGVSLCFSIQFSFMQSTQFYSPDKQRNLFINKRELFRLGENSFDFKFSKHQEQKKKSPTVTLV